MTKISGWVFMAIGAAVALFSKYVQRRGGEGMSIFFWAGIAMIGIGIFKIVLFFVLRDKKEKKEKTEYDNPLQRLNLNKDLQGISKEALMKERQQAMNKIQENSILVCPMCGTKHYSNSNFCHMCGSKLK